MARARAVGLRVAMLLVLLSCAELGCAASRAYVDGTHGAIVGTTERRVLSRLGPPDDFAFAGERRYYLYRLDLRGSAYRFGALDPRRAALCHVLVRIEDGAVSDVSVRGVDFAGMEADQRCAILARRLLR